VSFQDAQNSVDYYNFRYTAHFCKSKLKVTQKMQEPDDQKKKSRKRKKKAAAAR